MSKIAPPKDTKPYQNHFGEWCLELVGPRRDHNYLSPTYDLDWLEECVKWLKGANRSSK